MTLDLKEINWQPFTEEGGTDTWIDSQHSPGQNEISHSHKFEMPPS